MASSRSPSPSEGSSPPGTPLTPQSKIRALLATVDSSSDEDSGREGKETSQPKPSAGTKLAPIQSTDSSSDDENILRPRGKFAARMHAAANARQQSSSNPKEDARERVRKLLQAERAKSSPADKSSGEEHGAADDEEEVVTARPRKLKPRRQPSKTPETEMPELSRSPGLFVSPDAVRSRSPGLFVSPAKPASPSARSNAARSGSDSDMPNIRNERFLALVTKKRKERLAREAEEDRKRAARLAAQQAATDDRMSDEGDDSNVTDDEGGRRLTQDARPTRKASRKALEEMNRETQRLSRSLQLAHEAKTKKKISKSTLFERFNFKPNKELAEDKKLSSSSRPTSPASPHPTDTEMRDAETPPSSPPSIGKGLDLGEPVQIMNDNPEAAAENRLDKGKGKATARVDLEDLAKPLQKVKRSVRVKLPAILSNFVILGSDDELDMQPTRKSRIDAIFDRIPANKAAESRSLHALRRLAQVDDPEKKAAPIGKNAKPGMTVGELQISLQQRARLQAKLERDRRLELLKSKGIHIQTEEEREQEMAEVEDIVARARAEAEEIMTREREAAKKEKKAKRAAGELDPLAWDDSSDDEDYQDRGVEEEIDLSGSEDEQEEEQAKSDDEEEADENASVNGALIDGEAESAGESEDGERDDMDEAADSDTDAALVPKEGRRPRKHVTIISDDESDDPIEATPRPKALCPKSPSGPNTASPKVPTSVLRSATKTFIPGLPVAGPAGLGLTQIFAGTMDDSQAGLGGASPSQMMPSFDNFPDSNFSQTAQEPADDMILDSQPTQNATTQDQATQGVHIRFSQSQMHGFDSLLQDNAASQFSQLIEATQDGGFRKFTPLKQRFVEPPVSTIETVALGSQPDEMPNDSPLVRRVGKLRRRADLAAAPASASSDEDEAEAMEGVELDEFGFGTSAFSVMKDAAAKEKRRKTMEAFDKKKSKAKEMVDDQAEESEDEYAGLGGADGEDSNDEDAASVHEMIDDESKGNEVDDAKLAAFYADRERASDEKQVEKLFRDVTSGMLRRKRGADYDLSDSDDGGEARRRMKRRQFAKMQKALLADERVSKVAENPRNQAFLRTIEDRGSDDDMDFIFEPAPAPGRGNPPRDGSGDAAPESQSRSHASAIPDSQPGRTETTRPGPQRRVRDGKKPSTIGEIRESLSSLLEEPNPSSVIPATDLGSDSEDGDEHHPRQESGARGKENRNPRRGRAVAVVDRITLKRNASSSSASTKTSTTTAAAAAATNNNNNNGRLAFATSSSAAGSGPFKVPALLRRATTNSSLMSGGSGTTNASTGSAVNGGDADADGPGKVHRGAGRRSGVNYFARETERRAAVAESERRKEARRWKGAEGRGRVVGGLFGGGTFE